MFSSIPFSPLFFLGLRFVDLASPVRRQRTFHTYLVDEFCSVGVPEACKAPGPAPATPVFAVGAAAVVLLVIVIVAAPVAGYIQMILSLALC